MVSCMKINKTLLSGVHEIENVVFSDDRGSFVKTFNADVFIDYGLNFEFKESFYSVSKKDVIRGMHFQMPPMDHEKLVYVISGEILDVVVDVREGSPTYGQYITIELNDLNCKSIYIEKGFAHGFLTKSESATVCYMTTSVYSKDHDTGIKWDSFGFDWNVNDPVVSARDAGFRDL